MPITIAYLTGDEEVAEEKEFVELFNGFREKIPHTPILILVPEDDRVKEIPQCLIDAAGVVNSEASQWDDPYVQVVFVEKQIELIHDDNKLPLWEDGLLSCRTSIASFCSENKPFYDQLKSDIEKYLPKRKTRSESKKQPGPLPTVRNASLIQKFLEANQKRRKQKKRLIPIGAFCQQEVEYASEEPVTDVIRQFCQFSITKAGASRENHQGDSYRSPLDSLHYTVSLSLEDCVWQFEQLPSENGEGAYQNGWKQFFELAFFPEYESKESQDSPARAKLYAQSMFRSVSKRLRRQEDWNCDVTGLLNEKKEKKKKRKQKQRLSIVAIVLWVMKLWTRSESRSKQEKVEMVPIVHRDYEPHVQDDSVWEDFKRGKETYNIYMLNLRNEERAWTRIAPPGGRPIPPNEETSHRPKGESHRPHDYPKRSKQGLDDSKENDDLTTYDLIRDLKSFRYIICLSHLSDELNRKFRTPMRNSQRGMFYAILLMGLTWLGFSVFQTWPKWVCYGGYLGILLVFWRLRAHVEGKVVKGLKSGNLEKHLFYLILQESFRYEFYLDLAGHDPDESKLLHHRHEPDADFLRETLIFVGVRSRALRMHFDEKRKREGKNQLEVLRLVAPRWVERSWVRGQLEYLSERLNGLDSGSKLLPACIYKVKTLFSKKRDEENSIIQQQGAFWPLDALCRRWPLVISAISEVIAIPGQVFSPIMKRIPESWLLKCCGSQVPILVLCAAFYFYIFGLPILCGLLIATSAGSYFSRLLEANKKLYGNRAPEYRLHGRYKMGYRQKENVFDWFTRLLQSAWFTGLAACFVLQLSSDFIGSEHVQRLGLLVVSLVSLLVAIRIELGFMGKQTRPDEWVSKSPPTAKFMLPLAMPPILVLVAHKFAHDIDGFSKLFEPLTGFFLLAYILMTTGKRAIAMSEMIPNTERMIRFYESVQQRIAENPDGWYSETVATEMASEALKEVSDWKKLRRQHGDIFQPS